MPKRRLTFALVLMLALSVGGGVLRAATISLPASKNNTLIFNTDPANQVSNGAAQFIFAGNTDDGVVHRGLIAFDLSSIPAGATVQVASLTLYFDRSIDINVLPVSLFRLTRDWGEGTSASGGSGSGRGGGTGAPATQNDATWLYTFYNAANPSSSPTWTQPGGEGDYVTTPSATVQIQGAMFGVTPYTWSGSGVAADVQYWLDHPASDFGWLLKGDETGKDTVRRFESRHNSNDGTHGTIDALPALSVTYFVPEPSMLWPIAGVVVIRRRRRDSLAAPCTRTRSGAL